MVKRVVRIAIDSAPAAAGARRVVRSLEEIGRKSRDTAGEIGKVERALLGLRRAAGAMERVRLETQSNVGCLGRARSGAAPAAGLQRATLDPGSVGLANGFGGDSRRNPALRQAAAVAAGPIAKVLAELFLAVLVELVAEEVARQIRAGLGAGAEKSGPGQVGSNTQQLAELSEQLQDVQRELEIFETTERFTSAGPMDNLRKAEADLQRRIEAIERVIEEERAAARKEAFPELSERPLEGAALLATLLKESLPDIRDALKEILRLMQDLHDRAFSEGPAAPTEEINAAIGTSGLLQPAALMFPGGLVPHDGVANPLGANGAGPRTEHNLALGESISLFSRLEPEIEAAATAQHALNRGLEQGILNGRELGEGARRAFADYAEAATKAGAQVEQAIGRALGRLETALVGFVETGKLEWRSLVDAMIADLIRLFIRSQILGPLAQGIGGLFGGAGGLVGSIPGATFTAQGAAFQSGRQLAVGRGGVVGRPTLFPLAQGIGLIGEAGPEAVLPLERLPGGDLGVRAAGGGAVFNQTILNEAGVEIETEERANATGGIDQLLVLVRRDAERQMIEGRLGRLTAQRFGLSDRPVGR